MGTFKGSVVVGDRAYFSEPRFILLDDTSKLLFVYLTGADDLDTFRVLCRKTEPQVLNSLKRLKRVGLIYGWEPEGEEKKVEPDLFDFEALYALYPRKEGKGKGIAACREKIASQGDYERLKQAITRYRDYCLKSQRETEYIKHFSTFMSSWEEWAEEETGRSVVDIEMDRQARVRQEIEDEKRKLIEWRRANGIGPDRD